MRQPSFVLTSSPLGWLLVEFYKQGRPPMERF